MSSGEYHNNVISGPPKWDGTKRHLKQIVSICQTMGWSMTIPKPKHIAKKAKRWIKKHMRKKK